MSLEDNSENSITYYPVPTNVSTKFEFFPGFGWTEFKWVVVSLAIGGALFFLLGLVKYTDLIDPTDLTIEQNIGLEKNHLVYNEEGMIEIKKEVIPTFYRLLFIVALVAFTFLAVRREPSSNTSLLYMLKGSLEFKKRQKRFMYKYNSASGG